MKKNDIKITRVPGEQTRCAVTLKFEFDPTDLESSARFARIMSELLTTDEERAQFVADFQAARVEAGLAG